MSSLANDWKPTTISFSSGGVKAIGHMGAIMRLMEAGVTERVRSWYGCSAGSFCALVCALGVSAAWIKECSKHFDTRLMLNTEGPMIMDYMNTWGVSSGKELVETFSKFIDTWEPGSSTWTFKDLERERPGVFLGITAVNINKRELTLFSVKTHPHMLIMDAIRASSAIPLVYSPWISPSPECHYYCDGALIEQCPWFHIPEKKETLVIACYDKQITGTSDSSNINSFFDYCTRIVVLQRRTLTNERPLNWLAVNNNTVTAMDFGASLEDRLQLFEDGITAATIWLKQSSVGTVESPPSSVHQSRGSVTHPPSEVLVSDSRKSGIPLPFRAPPQDLPALHLRSSRRWSV